MFDVYAVGRNRMKFDPILNVKSAKQAVNYVSFLSPFLTVISAEAISASGLWAKAVTLAVALNFKHVPRTKEKWSKSRITVKTQIK